MGNTIIPEQLLDRREIVEEYLKRSSSPLSAFSFVSLFAWKDFFEFDLKIIDECLCVFAKNSTGCFLYWPPLGENVPDSVIDECFRIMERINQGNGVTRIENAGVQQLSLFPKEEFDHYRKGYEYCYYRDDIAALKGNLYKSKRSSYNQFAGQYCCDLVPYEENMREECLGLYNRWADARRAKHPEDDIYCSMLEENRTVHEVILRHYESLDMTGRVVRINGKVEAYTLGFPLGSSVFCVFVEVANLDIKGLATYIFREFCRDAQVLPYKFINGMDDFGLQNVSWTKMSFNPSVLLPSYVITKRV